MFYFLIIFIFNFYFYFLFIFIFFRSGTENWFSILRNGLKNASGTKLQLNGAAYGSGVFYLNLNLFLFTFYFYFYFYFLFFFVFIFFFLFSKKIYLSTIASTSFGYSKMHNYGGGNKKGNENSEQFLDSANFNCVALCEVINDSTLRKSGFLFFILFFILFFFIYFLILFFFYFYLLFFFLNSSIWVCPNEDHVVTRFLFVYRTDISYSGKWNQANTQDNNFKKEILNAMDLQPTDN